jgi:putative aldouronate transport system permease protein
MKKTRADKIFDICNTVLMVIVLIVMIYPLYFTVIASISEPKDVVTGQVMLLPSGFTLDAYKNVFRNADIWIGYRNTIFYTLFGTLLNLVLTLPTAYVLSKKRLHGRSFFSWFFLFTMFFGGGLIPFYLIIKDLGLLNTPYTLVILGGLSVYNMIVARVFFQTTIPEELYEAARMDGCSDFGQFFRIALPLSAPIIAVMALFYGVGRWNDFFTAMIFISNSDLYPLQLVLQNILIGSQTALASLSLSKGSVEDSQLVALTRQAYLAEAMKYALVFIASAPLLIAYPFVQKYFVKGVMIGSLKG